jgi:hypothetical protein
MSITGAVAPFLIDHENDLVVVVVPSLTVTLTV